MLVIYDTREKHPFDFSFFGWEMKRGTVQTGDYIFEELDICLERKRNTGEIAMNLGSKWKQFEAELNRMQSYKYKFIVCEFNINDISSFPKNSGIPQREWKYLKMTSQFIQKRFFEETSKRGIEIIFSANKTKAEEKVYEIVTHIKNGVNNES